MAKEDNLANKRVICLRCVIVFLEEGGSPNEYLLTRCNCDREARAVASSPDKARPERKKCHWPDLIK